MDNKAREIVWGDTARKWRNGDCGDESLMDLITQALHCERDAALEEAERLLLRRAKQYRDECVQSGSTAIADELAVQASRIRALKAVGINDLPAGFVEGVRQAQEEDRAGLAEPYKWEANRP